MKTIIEATGGAINSESPVVITASIAGPAPRGRIKLYCWRDWASEGWWGKKKYIWASESGDDLEISAPNLREARRNLKRAYGAKDFALHYEGSK